MDEQNLKIFYLKKKIIFPNCTLPVKISSTSISKSINRGEKILAYPVRTPFDLFFYKKRLATLSEILDVKYDEKSVKINLKGIARVRLKKINKFHFAEYEQLEYSAEKNNDNLRDELRKKSQELIFLINVKESDRLINLLNYLIDIGQMTDFISNYFVINFRNRFELYDELSISERGKKLINVLDNLIIEMKKKENRKQND